jgi:hypothetical protein
MQAQHPAECSSSAFSEGLHITTNAIYKITHPQGRLPPSMAQRRPSTPQKERLHQMDQPCKVQFAFCPVLDACTLSSLRRTLDGGVLPFVQHRIGFHLELLQMADLHSQSIVWEEDRSSMDVVIELAQHATDPGGHFAVSESLDHPVTGQTVILVVP